MNFLEKIIYSLSFKKINETMERESYKIAFFNALLSLFSIVCLVSSFYFYINLESIKSIILLSFFGLLLLNLFFLYKKRNKINLAISFFFGYSIYLYYFAIANYQKLDFYSIKHWRFAHFCHNAFTKSFWLLFFIVF